MFFWTEWTLATRFLLENRLQSLLILVGIAIGSAVIVFLSALISALQANLIDKTLGTQAHIRLSAAEAHNIYQLEPRTSHLILEMPRAQKLSTIANWQAVLETLDQRSELLAVSPLISGPAIAKRADARASVSLIGIEPKRYQNIIDLQTYLVSGQLALMPNDALIGVELAHTLGLKQGDTFRIDAGDGRETAVKVSGIFSLGVRELDERYVYLPLKQAQTLLDLPGGVTIIEAKVNDIFQANEYASQLNALTLLKSESWMQTNTQLLNALSSQSMTTEIIRIFIAISVAFGIASVLAVSVVQRTREIGILRAMGATAGQILRVFLIQGALLGLLGAILGCLLGAGLLESFARFGPNLFPVTLNAPLLLSAILLATIAGVVAALVPARRAARFDPAVAIRYV